MRTKFLLALCVLVLGISAQAKDYQYETVKGDMTRTRIYTLDNGLKVYLSVNNEKPRLQTFIAVRTGSKNDPAETTGLAHYLEHLMFKGTTHFGTTNAEAEAPLLEDIKARYERYRLLTDPDQRKQAYHEIDSVSQVAAQYFIPNEYDKLMAAIGAEGTNAFTSSPRTRSRTGRKSRATVSRTWSYVVSILSWKLCMRSITSISRMIMIRCGVPWAKNSHRLILMAHRRPLVRRNT